MKKAWIIFVTACARLGWPLATQVEPKHILSREHIRAATRIEVQTYHIDGQVFRDRAYVFEADGRCYVNITEYSNVGGAGGWRSNHTHELERQTFAQVRKILLDSRFLDLNQSQPGRNADHGLTVICGERRHAIHFSSLPGPRACRPLSEFLQSLLK